MIKSDIADFVINVALLLIFRSIYDFYWVKYRATNRPLMHYATGIVTGVLAILLMIFNLGWHQESGLLLDAKTVILMLSGLFLGAKPTITAAIMAAGYAVVRFYCPSLQSVTIFHTFENEVWNSTPTLVFDFISITAASVCSLLFHKFNSAWLSKHYLKTLMIVAFVVHVPMYLILWTLVAEPVSHNMLMLAISFLCVFPAASVLLGKLMANDIKRWDTETQLTISEEKFNNVALCSDDCFWEIDTNAKVTFVSDNVTKILGYEKDEIYNGNPFDLLYNIESKTSLLEFSRNPNLPHNTIFESDIVLKHKDGSQIHCKTRCMKRFNRLGKLIGFIGIVHNINDYYIQRELLRRNQMQLREQNKQYEQLNADLKANNEKINSINADLTIAKEQAEFAEKIKNFFIDSISAEIKTPLSFISGYLDNAINAIGGLSDHDTLVTNVKHQCDDIELLLTDVSDMGIINEGKMRITEEAGNMGQFFYEICEYYKQRCRYQTNRRINFAHTISIKGQQQAIKTDYKKLRQVLSNLINNSFKYTVEGEIKLSCSLVNDDNDIFFSVSDTGKGVDKEILDHFFVNSINGTGICLAVSKSIVELMGGTMQAESELGKGTTVSFTIPYHRAAHEGRTDVYKWSGRSIAILVKDRFTAVYLTDILIRTGIKYRVFTLEQSRPEVLNYAEGGFDCAIVDTRLAKSEFLAAVTAFLQYNTAAVIGLCLTDNHEVDKFNDVEYKSVIYSPLSTGEVCTTIETILQKK